MELVKARPLVMKHAKEDLAGNVSGRFSPKDWQSILNYAEEQWHKEQLRLAGDEMKAWHSVVRDFHRQSYWGFVPDYRPPRRKSEKRNLGIAFIWMAFQTFVITKIAVVWLGQTYSRTQDALDGWLFYSVIAVVLANFGFFLWRHRHHRD